MRVFALIMLFAACRIPDDRFVMGGSGDAGGGSDAGGDTAPPDAGCWSLSASNFDACAIGSADPDYTLASDATLNTTNGTLTTGTTTMAFGQAYTYSTFTFHLVYTHSFTIAAGVTLTVVGARPLLVVSDTTIEIDGTIDATSAVPAATVDADCNPHAAAASTLGPGGGGGAFGGDGGIGGNGAVAASATEIANGTTNLLPLRDGCPGQRGGSGTTFTGGAGGRAGGGVELSAHDQVTIKSSVFSDGGGGASGKAQSTTDGSGGGGGGAGGAILIEAPVIQLVGAKVCAVGGGGGNGAKAGTITSDGTAGVGCAVGIGATNTPGTGGDGGGTGAGAAGGAGSTSMAGGGGGGGAGRIVFHGTVMSSGIITTKPMPVTL